MQATTSSKRFARVAVPAAAGAAVTFGVTLATLIVAAQDPV
jgi:hypothetical protein